MAPAPSRAAALARGSAQFLEGAGRGLREFSSLQTQLRRSERMGAHGGLRVPGFWEVPASEPAHLVREAESPRAERGPGGGGYKLLHRPNVSNPTPPAAAGVGVLGVLFAHNGNDLFSLKKEWAWQIFEEGGGRRRRKERELRKKV